MLIFGSTALKHWFPDAREPKDLDIISREDKNTGEVYWTPAFEYLLENNGDHEYVFPNFLYTIKLSHSMWDVKWDKTLHDIKFLKRKGCIVDEPFYKLLIKDWSVLHGAKKAKLNKSNEDFFKDYVKRKYDHDFLHETVAYYGRPLFESIKEDLSMVQCSKKLFDKLSHLDKIRLCKEEMFVIALERYLIPNDFVFSERAAFRKAFKHLVTSMTAGWFPRFIMENAEEILNNQDWSWKNKLC